MAKTYEAMQRKEVPNRSGWQFLDLRNKKQLGDLDKKVSQFNHKNNYSLFNFTSCRGDEGTTSVLVNLINYLNDRKSDKRILVIDANFQKPKLHTVFKVGTTQGISDVLAGDISITEVIQQIQDTNFSIIPCGSAYKSQAGNILQEKLDEVLSEVKRSYDYIFIDSSPVLTSSDAMNIASTADVSFLIIQALKVQREVAQKAKQLLEDNECQIGGVILNRMLQVIPAWFYKIF